MLTFPLRLWIHVRLWLHLNFDHHMVSELSVWYLLCCMFTRELNICIYIYVVVVGSLIVCSNRSRAPSITMFYYMFVVWLLTYDSSLIETRKKKQKQNKKFKVQHIFGSEDEMNNDLHFRHSYKYRTKCENKKKKSKKSKSFMLREFANWLVITHPLARARTSTLLLSVYGLAR